MFKPATTFGTQFPEPLPVKEMRRGSNPSTSSNRFQESAKQFGIKYISASAAATVAEAVTYPLDITKTRLQAVSVNGGMLQVSFNIVRTEGPLKLWSGVGAAISRHYIYTGHRILFYEYFRSLVYDKEVEKKMPIWKSMICGVMAGSLAQFLANPTDLVKIQMQMEGLRKLRGEPLRYNGAMHCFKSLYRSQGFFGLWLGWQPNCQRAALINMADIAAYDFVKHKLMDDYNFKDGLLTHVIGSACAGFLAVSASLPADVVKTRMMDQIRQELDAKTDPKAAARSVVRYNGVVDCFVKIVRNEGFFTFYKGFLPSYSRMAPWQLTFWVLHEQIRSLIGAPSF